ncbi:hypothetical protein SNK04_004286 [Fusarium graminearum]
MDPFVYVAFKSKDGKQRFLGPAFVGASQAEFEKATAPGGSKRVSLEHTPGGGKMIMFNCPDNTRVSHVVAVDLDTEKLRGLKASYPDKTHLVKGDVSQESTNVEAVETAIRQGKRLTSLILNATTFKTLGPFSRLSLVNWKRAYDINFFAIVHMVSPFFTTVFSKPC